MTDVHETRAAREGSPGQRAAPRTAPGHKEQSVGTFARAVLGAELRALAAHVPASGAVPDPAAVHRMRIAARRLRVWLRLFGRLLLPRGEAPRLARDLRWFARRLSDVRDLDVYAQHLPSYIAAVAGARPEDLGGYELELRRARAEARQQLALLFALPRFQRLVADLDALPGAPEGGAPQSAADAEPVAQLAPRRVRKAVKRLCRRGRAIDADAPAKKLHRLRIEAKRVRYEIEFFASALPELEAAAQTTKRLQDVLGEFQDACMASARLEDYALGSDAHAPGLDRSPDCRQSFMLGRLMQAQVERAQAVRARFGREWRTIDKELRRARRDLKR